MESYFIFIMEDNSVRVTIFPKLTYDFNVTIYQSTSRLFHRKNWPWKWYGNVEYPYSQNYFEKEQI